MRWIKFNLLIFAMAFGGCSGEPAVEKAILGTWVQETPTSMTSGGIQTLTTDTVLQLKKNGDTHLTRELMLTGRTLPATGVELSVELRGVWELIDGQLRQTQNSALIIPRNSDKVTKEWADQLQIQAEAGHFSVKYIILANKEQLILQDVETNTTDTYRRK